MEIIVVVAIVALLATVVIANISSARKKSRDTQRVSDMAQIQLALRLYKDANGAYPDIPGGEAVGDEAGTLDAALAPYVTGITKDPINSGENQYYYDSSYTCSGSSRAVALAQTMEGTNAGNYSSVCGGASSDLGNGVVPSANSYIVILN